MQTNPKPQQPPNPAAKVNTPDNPILKLIGGQRVTLLLRNGSMLSGQIEAYKGGLISLGDVVAQFKQPFDIPVYSEQRLPWILIDRSSVYTIAPESTEDTRNDNS